VKNTTCISSNSRACQKQNHFVIIKIDFKLLVAYFIYRLDSLVTSEVVLLRKQLAEALETTLNLKQGREKLEEKTARHSQTVVQLQASLDENAGLIAALKENIKGLESQLAHK
jgi:hypothetical protein